MAKPKPPDPKIDALRLYGSLNAHPDRVQDPLFAGGDFFDARDLVQVKYEMLRAVEHEDRAVSEVAVQFGLSRPAFYRAKRDFQGGGLAGLSPHKRGPKAPRKVTPEILFETGRGIAPWMASVTFGGPDLGTVYIGSLKETSIPYFRSPVPGLPMVHWNKR